MPKGRGRRRAEPVRPLSSGSHVGAEEWGGEDWLVRHVTGSGAAKAYRCPGCDHLITAATPHVVAWPAEPGLFSTTGLEERRHWHTGCWRARDRRGRAR